MESKDYNQAETDYELSDEQLEKKDDPVKKLETQITLLEAQVAQLQDDNNFLTNVLIAIVCKRDSKRLRLADADLPTNPHALQCEQDTSGAWTLQAVPQIIRGS